MSRLMSLSVIFALLGATSTPALAKECHAGCAVLVHGLATSLELRLLYGFDRPPSEYVVHQDFGQITANSVPELKVKCQARLSEADADLVILASEQDELLVYDRLQVDPGHGHKVVAKIQETTTCH